MHPLEKDITTDENDLENGLEWLLLFIFLFEKNDSISFISCQLRHLKQFI